MAQKQAIKRAKKKPAASLSDYCRSLPGTTEDVKWGADLIFSVGKKMYAGFEADDAAEKHLKFKCDDIDFDRLTKIKGITPAPYAARFGWVALDRGAIPDTQVRQLIKKAHDLVVAGLPARIRRELGA